MWSRQRSKLHTLTTEQEETLLNIINEEFGSALDLLQFSEAMHRLFEDIPGFETIPKGKAKRYVNQLWRKYRGKETCKEGKEDDGKKG